MAGILLLAVLVLTGCGCEGKGVVVEKTHRDSYMTVMLVGKVPVPHTIPESWGYKVREDGTGEIHEVSMRCP